MDRKDLDVTLYLVTDSSYHTEESLLRTVEEACKWCDSGPASREE